MENRSIKTKGSIGIVGRVTIKRYRAGMVEAVEPYLKRHKQATNPTHRAYLKEIIEGIKEAFFIETAVAGQNLIMQSPNYGLDLIVQRLVGMNTYSLNILFGEIGTGSTTPAVTDTALTTPTNRATVGFQQDYGTTDAILQFFFSDSQLANATYYEFGTFVDGTSTLGSGQLFNHILFGSPYAKVAGQDTTCEVDFAIS
jgi:hypothetical protein